MVVVDVVGIALSGVALAHAGWWLVLSTVALPAPRKRRQPRNTDVCSVIIVPAHNEEGVLPATLDALLCEAGRQHRVVVVADNCDDSTARVARDRGVELVERNDPVNRGKAFALQAGIEHVSAGDVPDIVVFVDADCVVGPGFLGAVVDAFGTAGVQAVQAYYEPMPATTPLGRLRRLAFALIHWSRPLGARRLGLPTTIKGTGMALRWELVANGMPGGGLTEDASATLALARQGVAVEFVPAARLAGHMAQHYDDAATQDERWERGRFGLLREALATGLQCVLRGRLRPAAAAFEVASLPLSLIALAAMAGLGLGVGGFGSLLLASVATATLGAYVVVASMAARVSPAEFLALSQAPRFLLHKTVVYVKVLRGGPLEWSRTRR